MNKRALIWVESYQGIGHLVSVMKLAKALARMNVDVDIASSNFDSAGLDRHYGLLNIPFHTIVLPGFRDASGTITESGLDKRLDDEWHRARQSILRTAMLQRRYEAVITESWPFAKSPQHDIELEDLIRLARDNGAEIYCLIRDIITGARNDDPDKQYRKGTWGGSSQNLIRNLRRFGMRVLVRGDNLLHPFVDSFDRATEITDITIAPGYFVDRPLQLNDHCYSPDKPVLVSVGGWYFPQAFAYCKTCIRARKHSGILSRNPWILFVPLSAPEADFTDLQRLASEESQDGHVTVLRNRPGLETLFEKAALSVNPASYNTCMEAIAHETPMVVSPLNRTEQVIRGNTLYAVGLAGLLVLPESIDIEDNILTKTAEEWGCIIRATYASRDRLRNHNIKLDGAERFARELSDRWTAQLSTNGQAATHHGAISAHPIDVRAVILDWDNTLISCDRAVDLSFQHSIDTMKERGHKTHHNWTIDNKRRGTAPYDPEEFFTELFADPEVGTRAYLLQVARYLELTEQGVVKLFEGAAEVLSYCMSETLPVAIVSNSPANVLRFAASALLGDKSADIVLVGTTPNLPPKPHSQMMRVALSKLEQHFSLTITPGRSVISIGDSIDKDGKPSLEMGFTFVHFSPSDPTEYHTRNNLIHKSVRNHHELLQLLKTWRKC